MAQACLLWNKEVRWQAEKPRMAWGRLLQQAGLRIPAGSATLGFSFPSGLSKMLHVA
jgi:hypothetical protein